MEPENLTLRVLIEMRDEMRGMRGELVVVNTRLSAIESTLLDSEQPIRLLARGSSVGIRARRAQARRLDDLERRVGKLEQKPGA